MISYRSEIASIAALESQVKALVECEKFGDALDVIRGFMESVIFNDKSVAKVFSNTNIDVLCRLVGVAAATKTGAASPVPSARQGSVILATELVRAGGHVELIKDIVRLKLIDGPITIILTDFFARVDHEIISEFSATYGVKVEAATEHSSDERLMWTLDMLRRLAPATLVLLAHNQDGLSIAAAHSNFANKVIFIHHGDHHWSLGVTCKDFLHIDPSAMGYFHCRDEIGLENNRYWPLTVNCGAFGPKPTPFLASGHLVTCSSGRSEKYDASHYLYDYIEFIPRLLAATGGHHVHIGGLTDDMMERLQRGLELERVAPTSFVHVAWVPSVAKALIDYKVDLYMSSFPLGGGKACVEAMAAGIPLLMHQSYRSRFHGGVDMAYPEAWIWRTEYECLSILANIRAEDLERHSFLARKYYERFHSDRALIDAADLSKPQVASAIPNLRHFTPDALQTFIDETTEIRVTQRQQFNEIERINSEWIKAVQEINRLKGDLLAIAGEVGRVNGELFVEKNKSDMLLIENNRLSTYLRSPSAYISYIVKHFLSKFRSLN